MTGHYSIQTLDDFARLRELAPSLALAEAGSDLFCTLSWFENLAAHGFDPSLALHLVLVRDVDAATCFCLPLAGGKRLTGLSNYYSGLYGPVGSNRGVPPGVWRAVCRHIKHSKRRWPMIDLHPLDAAGPFIASMLAALKAEGYWADTYFYFGNWHLDVGGRPFADYFRALSSKLRNTVERGRKKLDREGNWNLTIHSMPGDRLESAIGDFETVYRLSWKDPEPYPHFIRGMCRTAAARGWLRLGMLKLNGEPIAAQIWLAKDGKAMIYKLAYDQRHARLSAGSVLTAALMRHAIDIDRVGEVDYLSGDDAYKRDWMSHRRERLGIVAFDPGTAPGLAAACKHFGGKWAKRIRSSWRNPDGETNQLSHASRNTPA